MTKNLGARHVDPLCPVEYNNIIGTYLMYKQKFYVLPFGYNKDILQIQTTVTIILSTVSIPHEYTTIRREFSIEIRLKMVGTG